MRVPSAFGSPFVRIVGVVLLVSAVALAVVLVIGPDDEEDGTGEVAELPGAVATGDGWEMTAVGWAPGATALSADDAAVRATDTENGVGYEVVDPASDTPQLAEPEPFGAVDRLDRAVASPSGDTLWVAEGSELLRLDPEGEEVASIALEHPGAITAVTDEAVWLTVSGVPVADETGVVAPRSVIQRVDVATGEVIAVPVDDPSDFHLAVEDDQVWATVGSTLQQLDPVTVAPVVEVALDAPASDLVLGADQVLVVTAGDAPQVVRVDPTTGAVTASRALTPGAVGEAALVGDDTELWILRPDGDAVDRLDLAGTALEPLGVVEPRRIEVTPDGVWILGGDDDGLVLVARRDAP